MCVQDLEVGGDASMEVSLEEDPFTDDSSKYVPKTHQPVRKGYSN